MSAVASNNVDLTDIVLLDRIENLILTNVHSRSPGYLPRPPTEVEPTTRGA